MSNYTPANALRELAYHADESEVNAALSAVIDALPEQTSATDDMSSAVLVERIFTALTGVE